MKTSLQKSKIDLSKSTSAGSAVADRFVIGSSAPLFSAEAKQKLDHKKPSKRAARLAAISSKANVSRSVTIVSARNSPSP